MNVYKSFDSLEKVDLDSEAGHHENVGHSSNSSTAVTESSAININGTAVPATQREDSQSELETNVRPTWSAKIDFILSAVGYAVGFGNIWRFPYLCYINGGGAFLIPYFFMMAFAGMPLFYLELALGQYASLGPITIWRVCPLFKGLGYAMLGISTLVSVYYNVILGLSVFYLISSFTSELPWSSCGHWWNQFCSNSYYGLSTQGNTCNNESFVFAMNVSVNETYDYVYDVVVNVNNCSNTTENNGIFKSAAEEYWEYFALGLTPETNISNIGKVRWHLTLCVLLSWIIVFLCIAKGVKSSGKVVYFTATFPYVVLFILFVRGVSLPGAGAGLKYYLTPDFKQMASIKVWNDAAVQILFSLGPGFGSLIMLGSYNKFDNKCNRDAVLVTLINCFTSFFAGFVIFSVLGFMSEMRQVPIDNVVDKGPGLAFVVYPEAIAMMPGSPFWSICFFFMLFTLGLDSQFVGVETIITGLVDEFPLLKRWKKTATLIVCIVLFLAGIPCVTQGAMYVIELIDKYTTSFPLLFVTFFEVIVISWIYGFRRFSADIKSMTGHKPNYYWLACWVVITPLIIVFILIFKCAEYSTIIYDGYKYPSWAEGVGWILSVLILIFIPLWMIFALTRLIGTWQNLCWVIRSPLTLKVLNLRSLIEPSDNWGPAAVKTSRTVVTENQDQDGSSFAVAYNEGRCFVVDQPTYITGESHI